MSVTINNNSGLIGSPESGCGCGNRKYYTKAEIDEMFEDILDPEQIMAIVERIVGEYVESEEFREIVISVIGEDYYTKAQIDSLLEGYATKSWTTGNTKTQIDTAVAAETARTEDVYAKKSEIPSLQGYATQEWVDDQGFLKDITLTINGTQLHNNGEIIIQGGGGEPVDISGKLDTTAFTQAMESETARTEDTYAKIAALADKLDTSAFNTFKSEMEECCREVKSELILIRSLIGQMQEEIDELKPDTGSTGYTLTIVYNVTSTTQNTQILNSTTGIKSFVVDDGTTVATPGTTYRFDSTGERSITYTLLNDKLPAYAFKDLASIRRVTISDGVTGSGYADGRSIYTGFAGCTGLQSATLNFKIIDGLSFSNCTSLNTVVLGTRTEALADSSFFHCTSLRTIKCYATTAPKIINNAFKDGVPNNGTLYYPSGSDYSSWFGGFDPLHSDYATLPVGWTGSPTL